MKNLLFFLTLVSLAIFMACNPDDESKESEVEFTGEGIFTCLVNGEPFDIETGGSYLATFETVDFITIYASMGLIIDKKAINLSVSSNGKKIGLGEYDIIPLPTESNLNPKGAFSDNACYLIPI